MATCVMCWSRETRADVLEGSVLEGLHLCGRCGIQGKQTVNFLVANGFRVLRPGEDAGHLLPAPEPPEGSKRPRNPGTSSQGRAAAEGPESETDNP